MKTIRGLYRFPIYIPRYSSTFSRNLWLTDHCILYWSHRFNDGANHNFTSMAGHCRRFPRSVSVRSTPATGRLCPFDNIPLVNADQIDVDFHTPHCVWVQKCHLNQWQANLVNEHRLLLWSHPAIISSSKSDPTWNSSGISLRSICAIGHWQCATRSVSRKSIFLTLGHVLVCFSCAVQACILAWTHLCLFCWGIYAAMQ